MRRIRSTQYSCRVNRYSVLVSSATGSRVAGKSGAGACGAQSAHVRSVARTHHAPNTCLFIRDRGRRTSTLRPAPGWRAQRASRRAEHSATRSPPEEVTTQLVRHILEEQ